jgi:hypothetical protein
MLQIKLRRVKRGGMCLGQDCVKKDCDELFIIAVESETRRIFNVLTMEALCRECALTFMNDLRTQCSVLGKQIFEGNYTLESSDIYERSILDDELLVQEAVASALRPEWGDADNVDEPENPELPENTAQSDSLDIAEEDAEEDDVSEIAETVYDTDYVTNDEDSDDDFSDDFSDDEPNFDDIESDESDFDGDIE